MLCKSTQSLISPSKKRVPQIPNCNRPAHGSIFTTLSVYDSLHIDLLVIFFFLIKSLQIHRIFDPFLSEWPKNSLFKIFIMHEATSQSSTRSIDLDSFFQLEIINIFKQIYREYPCRSNIHCSRSITILNRVENMNFVFSPVI